MKLSRLAVLTGSILLATSLPTLADDHEYAKWGAGYFEHYQASNDKPNTTQALDNGNGFGIEIGRQFSEHWAGRIEYTHQDISGIQPQFDQSGTRFGIDAMLLLDDSFLYIFGGVKNQNLDTTFKLVNVGIGKHWQIKGNWRVLTEVANYFDLDESYSDLGVKVGLAYNFGGSKVSSSRNEDSDNDGVYDRSDECPTTPAGQAVDRRGCSLDSDNDGVLNSEDQCPNTPRGTAVDAKGCALPKDSDGDGVYDTKDQCPNTPNGRRVDAVGCSVELDSDNDGVIDRLDRCPGTPESDKVDSNGCSIFTDKEVSIALNVQFANNSAEIDQPGHSDFVEFAAFLKRFPETQAEIAGHSSKAGAADYNLQLSQRRADAVKDLMVNRYGISASRLNAVGYGEERPLDNSGTAEAARKNRRIEAIVTANERVKETK
ncbi:OmpA family protein [Alteromonadaceae bacterium M269]|nr:OmpA family protein [Alteromonadaceae bacterium M269]